MTTMKQLTDKLASEGGCIVSTADCSELEIANARGRGDFYADENGYGYVRRIPEWLRKHSRFARGATDSCEHRMSFNTGKGAGNEMERERRYCVLKVSDFREALDADEIETLASLADKIAAYRDNVGKLPLRCAVVESEFGRTGGKG